MVGKRVLTSLVFVTLFVTGLSFGLTVVPDILGHKGPAPLTALVAPLAAPAVAKPGTGNTP